MIASAEAGEAAPAAIAIGAATTKPFGYLRFVPGPGVGGHCLPIDPSYLSWRVQRTLGQSFRFVELANDINDHMPDYVVQRAVRDLDRYIAATQVGITLASLLLGGIGERSLEPILSFVFGWVPEEWQGLTRGALVAGSAYFIMTALHVIIGVMLQLLIALLFRSSVARPMPLLALLALELVNEANDFRVEIWPDPGMQFGEAVKDVVLTMFIPTLTFLIARRRPKLLVQGSN